MNNFKINIPAEYAAHCTDVLNTLHGERKSYLICRILTDSGVIRGKAVTGTRRTLRHKAGRKGALNVYFLNQTQYGWIVMPDGRIADPLECIKTGTDIIAFRDSDGCYVEDCDPVTCDRQDLPEHHTVDEIFRIRRGVMRETCMRLLGYDHETEGLTISEAAWIASRPLSEFGVLARRVYEHFIFLRLSRLLPLSNVLKVNPVMGMKMRHLFFRDAGDADAKSKLRG